MAGQPEVRGIQTLVLAPTRELAAQIIDNVRIYGKHLGFRSAAVFGGVGEKPQIDALRAGTPFVVACPGRLLDLMNRGFGDFSRLRYLVLDEADRMLDMGFLPDMRRILAKLPKDRQTLLFSATLSREIESLSRDFQRDPELVEIGKRTNPAETVTQEFCEVEKARKPALLVKLLEDPAMSMVLVFTRTKHGADRIAKLLERQGIRTGALHANRSQGQRLRALGDFRDGRLRVLVATDIAARGIDVEGISHVVNFDFPPQVEDYVHRIGRTGRAAAVGHAISFITGDDRDAVRALERRTGRVVPRMMPAGFDAGNAGALEPPRQAQGRGGRPQGRPGNAGGRPQGRPGNSGGGAPRGPGRPAQGPGRPQRSGPRPEQSSGERAAPRAEASGEAREAERPTLRGRRLRKW
jgi:ATP-dependent RNA helicase RhlE